MAEPHRGGNPVPPNPNLQYPQATPLPSPYPPAQGVGPGQPYPQGQVFPQTLGYPQAQPVTLGQSAPPQPQPFPQGQVVYPQAQPLPPGAGQVPQSVGQAGGVKPILVQQGTAPVRPRDEDEEEGEEQADVTERVFKAAPPWLVSTVFHMIVFIVLGLLVVSQVPKKQVTLEVEQIYAEKLGEQLEFDSPLAGREDTHLVQEPILTPDNLPEVDNPFAAPPDLPTVDLDAINSVSKLDASVPGWALKGRDAGHKKGLLAGYGGNALTEAAVVKGLEWLARNQQKDGSWSLLGPYRDGAVDDNENMTAATAMALLAFQGHGDTHQKGDFHKNVANGWKWLLGQQDADGNFFHEGPYHHRFYTNGQCSIALCELFGMSQDAKLKEPALRAIDYLLKSQSSEGGWRYVPQSDSDVSVTGWIVMALQSAKMAGIEVPPDTFRRVERFLDSVAVEGGARYPYQKGEQFTATMTAEAMLCRQYLGWPRSDPRLISACDWLTEDANLVSFSRGRNVYYWYYATQVLHHMEGEYWEKWNAVMRQALPEQQVKTGNERGSWDPLRPTGDQWEAHGGRLFVTCLSIYMLEVYYRHLPLYNKLYNPLAFDEAAARQSARSAEPPAAPEKAADSPSPGPSAPAP